VHIQRVLRRSDRSDLKVIEGVSCSSRRGHLGSDHVDRRFSVGPSGLCSATEPSRTQGDDLVGDRTAITAAGHTGIQMNLGEAGTHILGDHLLREAHGLFRRLCAPRIRPQVIAAENQPLGRQTGRGDMPEGKIAEGRGTHPGVSAELIDLVAGRFQQQERS
jgi:hypothetical protein